VVEKYGGRYLARSGEIAVMVGDWQPERIVLIQFESIDQVQEFFASPEYLALVLLGRSPPLPGPLSSRVSREAPHAAHGVTHYFL